MCEINPAHTLIMRLEAFTSDRRMSKDAFEMEVGQRVMEAEQALNADGKFRFHVHSEEPKPRLAIGTCAGCNLTTMVSPLLVKSANLKAADSKDEHYFHCWKLYCETCEEHVIAGNSDMVLYNA